MALEGFLQEFGLADILQLIYFQKKTGILRIEGKTDRVKLSFINGNITNLESQRRLESNRLGKVLIKKGLISQQDLDAAMETQKKEGNKLGNVLVKNGLLPKETLEGVIQEQIIESIVQIFAWKEGRYEFTPQEVSVDKELSISLDTQHLLMEGLKIVDEWSLIEGKLDLNTIYKKIKEPGPDELNKTEEEVLDLLDGESDASTIINICYSGDFETSKALIALEEKGIIEAVESKPVEKVKAAAGTELKRSVSMAILAAGLIVFISIIIGGINAVELFRDAKTGMQADRIKARIDIYNAVNGHYPESLGIIDGGKDRWGKPYIYRKTESGFTLFSSGPDGIAGTRDDIY